MNANDLFKAVMELDLDPIKVKLMHVESGEGWSRAKADAVEKEYRRFLCLMKLYPEEDTAPLVDVDTFWHYHILDTMKYAIDCQTVFGGFLHHYPYVGMRGEADEEFRLASGERMRRLYESTFGEAYPGARTPAAEAARNFAVYTDPYFERLPAVDATAYCAGPHEVAYCAGPHESPASALAKRGDGAVSGATAYCAGPHEVAYCAGPHESPASALAKRGDGAVSGATAYCAGPHEVAYCAGPHESPASALAKRGDGAVSGATAYCAGPHEVAYCAGPHESPASALAKRGDGAVSGATAYCAGPHEVAYCAGPHEAPAGGSRLAAYEERPTLAKTNMAMH